MELKDLKLEELRDELRRRRCAELESFFGTASIEDLKEEVERRVEEHGKKKEEEDVG